MASKYAKISFKTKTLDCQYCRYKTSRRIPATDIVIHFCTYNLPNKVYQLRGQSNKSCKLIQHTS